MTAIVLTGLAGIIIYAVIKTLWVFCPRLLIRWADYFGISISEKEISPLFEDEIEEKQIEVKEIRR